MSHPVDSPMNHEEASAELGAFALGALDAEAARAVEAHLLECAACSAEVAALRTALSDLPPTPPSSVFNPGRSNEIRSRLVARAADADQPARTSTPWRLIAMAASLALVATGLGYARERSKRTEVEQLYTQRLEESAKLQAEMRGKDSELAAITGPSVSVMEMSATGVNAPTARMFWDRATNRWTVFAHGLAQPEAGRAYELWLVTADKKIPAGVFKPSEDGSAVFTATYALRPEDLKAIAVTEEPEAGVQAPTGPIILLGSAAGT